MTVLLSDTHAWRWHTQACWRDAWLKIAAERAAQLYMGCRCPGSVACGADWHVHAGMAQDRRRDAKSESRTVASQAMHPRRHRGPIRHGQRASLCALTGPRSCEASAGWGGAFGFEPRVLARVALLDVSLVREAWRHSWTSIPNLGRAPSRKSHGRRALPAAFSQHRWRRAKSQSPISSTPCSAAPAPSALFHSVGASHASHVLF